MRKCREPLFARRTLMTVAGVLTCGFSVGIFKTSALGVDPFQVLCNGINAVVPIPFGTLYVLINIVLLIAMFFADRRAIGLGTLINLFLLGYVVDFSERLWTSLFPAPSFAVKLLLLLAAIPLLCISSALYFTADMGVSTYDVWALWLDRKTKFPFRFLRICTDLLCVGTGFALMGFRSAGVIGIGTIVTALFMGPLIDLFNRKVARPLLYGKGRRP
ncbi:MAG: YitT family protein [Clostridia bacterium]|nr:YitT family protein [Clostridia bacterium]